MPNHWPASEYLKELADRAMVADFASGVLRWVQSRFESHKFPLHSTLSLLRGQLLITQRKFSLYDYELILTLLPWLRYKELVA